MAKLKVAELHNPKIVHSHGVLHTHQYMVPWANPSQHPNGISIGSAVFAGFTNVTNIPTDHATPCVPIDRCCKLQCGLIIIIALVNTARLFRGQALDVYQLPPVDD